MGLVGHLLLLDVAIALSPLVLIAFVVVSCSRSGPAAGWGFIAGWVACLVVLAVGFSLLFPEPSKSQADAAGSTSYAIELAVGAGLLFFAWRSRQRIPPADPQPSKLLLRIEGLGVLGAAVAGALVQPWGLVGAGVMSIGREELSTTAAVTAIVGFELLCTAVLLGLQLMVVRSPEQATVRLGRLRHWVEGHQTAIATWGAAIVGFWLITHAIAGLH